MESKKSGSGPLIVLLLVIIVILGGFIYMKREALQSQQENKNPGEAEIVSNDQPVELSTTELEYYINEISPISIGPSALIYNTDRVIAKELSARQKIEYIASRIYEKHTTSENGDDVIKEEDVKKEVEEVYGPSTYERGVFNLGCGDYNFNVEDSSYYSVPGCGGATTFVVKNELIDYSASKTKLEITTAYVFYDATENKIYKDYEKTTPLEEYQGEEEVYSYLSKYIKEHKENLNHIVYKYESQDGAHYYFREFIHNK